MRTTHITRRTMNFLTWVSDWKVDWNGHRWFWTKTEKQPCRSQICFGLRVWSNELIERFKIWLVPCENCHSWTTNNVDIRWVRFRWIFLMFWVKIETFFMEFIFFPLCANWCGHVNVLIFRVVSGNVLEQCPEHFAVIFTFCAYPFDTTFVISFPKRKENEISYVFLQFISRVFLLCQLWTVNYYVKS